MEQSDVVGKASHLTFKWVRLAWVRVLKFVKIRVYKLRLRRAKYSFNQRMSRLGLEFYSLHKQGETEFLKSLVILQQLKIVEEAESQVLAFQDRIEGIDEEYRKSRDAIMAGSAKQD